ncbi:MAG: hypothetical protein M3O46_18405 [Myxococcota bacterium]|nr:hypothetical protein [Myxococcota bacterium]
MSCGACTQPDTCGGGGTKWCGNNLQDGCGGGVTCQCLALPPDDMVTVCASGACATQCPGELVRLRRRN